MRRIRKTLFLSKKRWGRHLAARGAFRLAEYLMLQNLWNFRPPVSILVSTNTILTHTMALPAARKRLRFAGDTANELRADPEQKHVNESTAACHYDSCQRDCTTMVDLL
jgi:hypothetical protein